MKNIAKSILATVALTLLAAHVSKAEVKFLPKVLNKTGYQAYPDLAYVEAAAPLSLADRAALTGDILRGYNQEQLDQLYARLTSGPMPIGDYKAMVFMKNPLVYPTGDQAIEKFTENGLTGFIAKLALGGICQSKDRVECLVELLWSGKRFYEPNSVGEVQVRSAVTPNLRIKFLLDQAGLGAMFKPLTQVPLQTFGDGNSLMLFPSEAYCGISLFDTRRESIIIDSAYGDDFTPYVPEVDGLISRNGTWGRDEIRMVRPGLYLGRAYVDRIFLLNFVLENKDVEARVNSQGNAVARDGFLDWLFGNAQPAVPAEVSWKNICWDRPTWQ